MSTNPFDLNPEAMAREIFDFNSRLLRGMSTLQSLGEVAVGTCEKEAIHTEDKVVLYHYAARTAEPHPVPVLIVYALVNRPYMADLQEGRSLVQGLLDRGMDVYLIDWGYPDEADRFITLDDYINGYLDRCIDVIRDRHGLERINLLGICQGGTFSLCYAALHAGKVQNLITTVTPVDFHTQGDLLGHLARNIDVDRCVETLGNIPGELLNWTFLMMKPFRLMSQKYMELVDILDDPARAANFMRMEKWIFDSPDQAGEAYREFITQFYVNNALISAGVRIGGHEVDLGKVTMPVLNIYARDDHLVPPEASRALAACVGTEDYTELEFPGGHIGLYVSAASQSLVPPAIADWLRARPGRPA